MLTFSVLWLREVPHVEGTSWSFAHLPRIPWRENRLPEVVPARARLLHVVHFQERHARVPARPGNDRRVRPRRQRREQCRVVAHGIGPGECTHFGGCVGDHGAALPSRVGRKDGASAVELQLWIGERARDIEGSAREGGARTTPAPPLPPRVCRKAAPPAGDREVWMGKRPGNLEGPPRGGGPRGAN